MASEVTLPKLKEGVDTYEVNEILVKEGETVEQGQPVLVVNADKANMDVKAPQAGKVVAVKVKLGDQIKIGEVYCVLEANGPAPAAPAAPKEGAGPAAKAQEAPVRGGNDEVARQHRTTDEPTRRDVRAIQHEVRPTPGPVSTPGAPAGGRPDIIPAGPATRWLARKLGVDLKGLRGSGPNGRITEEDVKGAFGGGPGQAVAAAPAGLAVPALPRFEDFGPVDRQDLTRVRKLTAQKMSLAWSLIPHVTQHDIADITDLEAFRKSRETKDGPKLTVTAFALKACVAALKQFPQFNSTLDLARNQLVFKKYYHIGVAVDTKAGLLVPVIRDVDKKGVEQLAKELTEAAEQARQGRANMDGGSFTITNLGGIGGTGFTPIINWPEVAILGLSRSRWEPVVKDGQVVPRLILPLSLSYDHRVIDGADAARFTRRIAEMLENPWLMALYA